MKSSENITAVLKTMDNVSRQVGTLQKTALNPFFKNKYVKLEQVQEALLEACEGSLTISQPLCGKGIMTIISDVATGDWIAFESEINAEHLKPQDQMSGVTYMKRYALIGAFNIITGDEDDDGNSTQPTNTNTAKSDIVTEDQIDI